MVRLGDAARFDSEVIATSNRRAKNGLKPKQIVAYIRNTPGQTTGDVCKALGFAPGYTWTTLRNLADKGKLRFKELDGSRRYYAANYRFAGESKQIAEEQAAEEGVETVKPPETKKSTSYKLPASGTIASQAAKYLWLYGGDRETLRGFLKWLASND